MKHVNLLFLLLLASACSPAEDGAGAAASSPDVPHTALAPDISIGGGAAPPEYEFGRVGGVAIAEDGRIVVADLQNHDIRVFTPGGEHQFSFGRRGAGPGELDGPCCLAFDADGQLWVRDGGNRRYSVYRLGADSAHYLGLRRMVHGDVNRMAPLTFDDAGRLIDIGARSDPATGQVRTWRFHLDESGTATHEVPLQQAPPDSTGMKTVERQLPNGTARLFVYPPHGPAQLYAHSPRGEYVHGVSSAYALDWRGADGALLRRITGPVQDGPQLNAEERERAEQQIVRDVERLGVSRGQLGYGVPDRKQPLRGIFFDGDGRLWVELSVPGGADRQAHVYGVDGELERTVSWPATIDLRGGAIAHGETWGIARDEHDVEILVRLR